ncbi:class I SAM-dependent methyltransferase [Luteimonas sp. R10]|uniref:class I SAM-dependent methyltransferase n=1 Tax=Luteimonas sp. R10 TaxID=3108176 RepID=UPI0030863B3A|nr:methyltransferase [Luteimonas sp. R10]
MPTGQDDPALETLLLPFASGRLEWPRAGALFLRARTGPALAAQPRPGLVCEQSFRPELDALRRAGFEVRAPGEDRYPLVLLLPPRQREEARALYAQALARVSDGGTVVASQANDEGAKSGEADLARIAGQVTSLSKHKCRVFWARPGGGDAALAAQWRALDAPRPVVGGRFLSRPGVFAWDRIDAASALLAAHLPPTLAGHGADLGAGYGFLAAEVLQRCPGVTALDLYEAEKRALDLAVDNLAVQADRVALGFHWHDVAAGLPRQYDFIVSNPPFHAGGRAPRPDIGRRFIAAAAQSLRPGGALWLVANRQLPYEQALGAGFGEVRIVAQRQGFKVVEARRACAIRGRGP